MEQVEDYAQDFTFEKRHWQILCVKERRRMRTIYIYICIHYSDGEVGNNGNILLCVGLLSTKLWLRLNFFYMISYPNILCFLFKVFLNCFRRLLGNIIFKKTKQGMVNGNKPSPPLSLSHTHTHTHTHIYTHILVHCTFICFYFSCI